MTEMNKINFEELEIVAATAIDDAVNGITHGGVFHADEALATAVLWLCGLVTRVARVFRLPEQLPATCVIYDVGGEYDPEGGRFDHHQKEYFETREGDDVKYSSAGLVWKAYGHLLCPDERVWQAVDARLFRGVDATDNGQAVLGDCMSLASLVSSFNPEWNEDDADANAAFKEAVRLCVGVLKRTIRHEEAVVAAEDLVGAAVADAEGQICVLPRFAPWQAYVENTDLLYVIFPSNRGGYNVQAVAVYKDGAPTFETRKGLPWAWRGKRGAELAEVCGVTDATFVHPAGFIGGAASLDGALAMARAARDAE